MPRPAGAAPLACAAEASASSGMSSPEASPAAIAEAFELALTFLEAAEDFSDCESSSESDFAEDEFDERLVEFPLLLCDPLAEDLEDPEDPPEDPE